VNSNCHENVKKAQIESKNLKIKVKTKNWKR